MGPRRTMALPATTARPRTKTNGATSLIALPHLLVQLMRLILHRQRLAQKLARERSRGARHLLRDSARDHAAARVAALGPEVDHPVRRLHDVEVVLDHDDGVALVNRRWRKSRRRRK